MMIYCWIETAYPQEPKVGEHWVNNMTLEEAEKDTIIGRIRPSLGVRKDHFDRGRIKILFVIDASDYAKKKNKFHPKAKLDAELHQLIEGRYGRGEVFDCDTSHVIEVVEKEIGPINTDQIQVTIKSRSFRTLIRMKDKENCILDQGDPENVWKDVIDGITINSTKKKRPLILFVACGYGTEITLFVKKLHDLGWSDEEIKKSITINDKSDQFTKDWEEAGYNVVVGDFLYLDFGMKFDIILGNPPYNKGLLKGLPDSKRFDGLNGYPHLYFIQKSIHLAKENANLSFVIPAGLMTLSSLSSFRASLLEQVDVNRLDILPNSQKEIFCISQTNIMVLNLVKRPYQGRTLITRKRIDGTVDSTNVDLTKYSDYWPMFYGDYHREISELVEAKRKSSNQIAPEFYENLGKNKAFVSFGLKYNGDSEAGLLKRLQIWESGSFRPNVDSVAILRFEDLNHRDKMFEFYQSKLFALLLSAIISTDKIQPYFPVVIGDFDFDDQPLYEFFELPDHLIDYIEHFHD